MSSAIPVWISRDRISSRWPIKFISFSGSASLASLVSLTLLIAVLFGSLSGSCREVVDSISSGIVLIVAAVVAEIFFWERQESQNIATKMHVAKKLFQWFAREGYFTL